MELLVVIAIIGILIALLLPAMGKARETASRVTCLSMLHQQHIGASVYASDYTGNLPYLWSNWDASLATEATQHTTVTYNGEQRHTGWKVFDTAGYMTQNMFTCPSQKDPPTFGGGAPGIHYSYRYNSRRTLAYLDNTLTPTGGSDTRQPSIPLMYDETRARRGLFTDASMGRRDGGGAIVTENTGYGTRAWAHVEGGNVVDHSGRGIWLPNQDPGSNAAYQPGWPHQWYIWYGNGWTGVRSLDTFLMEL